MLIQYLAEALFHKDYTSIHNLNYIIQICSGITRGRVLNGEPYAQRLQKLFYMHWPTDCFMKLSLQSIRQICSTISPFYIHLMRTG